MNRIERIGPLEGSEPVRLTILTPLEREHQREERERRRRGAQTPDDSRAGRAGDGSDEPPRRLDLRA